MQYQAANKTIVPAMKKTSTAVPMIIKNIRWIAPMMREIKFHIIACPQALMSNPLPYAVISLCQGENRVRKKRPTEKNRQAQMEKFLPAVIILIGKSKKNQDMKVTIRLLSTFYLLMDVFILTEICGLAQLFLRAAPPPN